MHLYIVNHYSNIQLQDQLYLREEGMQRLFVQWKQQRIEFWVSVQCLHHYTVSTSVLMLL